MRLNYVENYAQQALPFAVPGFRFSELKSPEDLSQAFHLRWKERAVTNSPFLSIKGDCELDIDEFDYRSLHFGCFEEVQGGLSDVTGSSQRRRPEWLQRFTGLQQSIPGSCPLTSPHR